MNWLRKRLDALRHPASIGSLLLALGFAVVLPPLLTRTNLWGLDPDFGDIVAICAFVATVVLAVVSVIPNLQMMADTSRSAHYSELDKMYLHLLTMAVERPFLRDPDNQTEAERAAYQPYAFMVWNFLETIHDRCAGDPALLDTWLPVIGAEEAIHRRWFEAETCSYESIPAPKFCLTFCDFVWRAYWLPDADADITAGPEWARRCWAYRTEARIKSDPAVALWYRARAVALEPVRQHA